MVHGEGHLCTSTTPGRETERNSDERQVKLDALPDNLSDNPSQTGPSGSGLICIEIVNPTLSICELEAGPGGNGHGCLHYRLGGPEGLCQPTLEHCWQGTCPCSTDRRPGPNSTRLENSSLVSCATCRRISRGSYRRVTTSSSRHIRRCAPN